MKNKNLKLTFRNFIQQKSVQALKLSIQPKQFLLAFVYISAATLFLSCQPAQMNSAAEPTMGDLHKPPTVMEQPEVDSSLPTTLPTTLPTADTPAVTQPEVAPEIETPIITSEETTNTQTQAASQDQTVSDKTKKKDSQAQKKNDKKTKAKETKQEQKDAETKVAAKDESDNSGEDDNLENSNISDFIRIAHKVMVNEGKQIGTPCNFYLHRVLTRAGFKNESFGANDFDIYAKRNFSSYKAQDFKLTADKQANAQEQLQLQRYIWSYPVRTPFILQWTRPAGRHGHVAIIERFDENTIVIYQASLNRHSANRKETTIKTLLTTAGLRSNLTVYSEFKAKK